MLRLTAAELLKAKGKSRYWLNKQLNMGDQNLRKMLNNETKSIRYETLELLCLIFECTPNELLVFDESRAEGN